MTYLRTHIGVATLVVAGLALLPASAANAADKDIIGLWTDGVVWGQANQIAFDKKGELNPTGFGVGNTTERTSFGGRYSGGERFIIAEQDPGVQGRQVDNVPLYKPEHWEELYLRHYLHHSDPTGEFGDPRWKNLPVGMPQLGAPGFIVPGPRNNELFFIYQNENQWRYIPTDCRKHDESLTYDVSFNGHSVGCWEGNTLVVTSKGFTTDSYVWRYGGLHSAEMEIVERFTPNADGTRIVYERTVHDPMFLQPWKMDNITMNRNANPMAFLAEDYPYVNPTVLEVGGGC